MGERGKKGAREWIADALLNVITSMHVPVKYTSGCMEAGRQLRSAQNRTA